MPALIRGGSHQAAKPRAKAGKVRGGRSRAPARSVGGAAPAKIRAARSVGLRPGAALTVAGAIALVGVAAVLATGGRWRSAEASLFNTADVKLGALGFRVASVQLQGVSAMARGDILHAAGVAKNEPILGLDLNAVRGRIERVGWVKSVQVVRLLPDTLVIAVSQRTPNAVWQHNGRMVVVDETGAAIAEADPGHFADLPLVVGEGANQSSGEILPLLRARPQLMSRLEALVRVDDRRWDVRLKDGGLIQLPATGADSALIQLDQLEQQGRILELGFARIDLRDPDLVAVRPKDGATAPAAPTTGA